MKALKAGCLAALMLFTTAEMAGAQTSESPQGLVSGESVTNLSDSAGNDRYFFIDVPANTTVLRVELLVSSGDPDIYVDTTNPPPADYPGTAQCFSYNPPTESELCVINAPEPGRYFIRVNAWENYAGAVLTVTLPPAAPIVTAVNADDESLNVVFQPGSPSDVVSGYTATCTVVSSAKVADDLTQSLPAARSSGVERSIKSAKAIPPAKTHSGLVLSRDNPVFQRLPTGEVLFREHQFESLSEFHSSRQFHDEGLRCGIDMATQRAAKRNELLSSPRLDRAADCTNALTQISPEYAPLDAGHFIIPVVVHVIYRADGFGFVTEQRVVDQIAVLNEDFGGAMGLGTDTSVEFELIDITYTANDGWFTDSAEDELAYKSALGQDTSRYLNIYTNDAGGGGVLGYAYLPQGSAGGVFDGVVMLHSTIGGRDNGFGQYDNGRTLVHEVGHYLGLAHTFAPDDSSACENTYSSGDLIVDTPPQAEPDSGCASTTTCGTPSAIENFMNYSDDACMNEFTAEQTNRMICSLTSYRPSGFSLVQDGIFTASGASSPLSVAGLTNGVTYSCSVKATNAAGGSVSSNSLTGIPEEFTATGLPIWLLYEATQP